MSTKNVSLTIRDKWINNFIKVIFSNIMLIVAGIATSFLLPIMLSVNGYGLYRLFNLYVSYIILLQFGFIEGIYIKYSGQNYENINRVQFFIYTKAILFMEIIVTVIIALTSMLLFKNDYLFIGILYATNILAVNLTNYFQYISQATQRFAEISIRNVCKSVLTISVVVFMWIAYKSTNEYVPSYQSYIIIIVAVNYLLLMWYIYTYREIIFIKSHEIKLNVKHLLNIFQIGIPLLFSNIISNLIFTIDKFIVSIFFNIETYAIYSFAFSMITFVSTVITSISVVLFPAFKQKSKDYLFKIYSNCVAIISIFVFALLISYYPLCWLIQLFLPDYIDSLLIFRVILPGLAISAPIVVVMHNFFKSLGDNLLFFKKSLIVLLLSLFAYLLSYFIFGTVISISIVSIIIMFIWYLLIENTLKRKYDIGSRKNVSYIVLMTICFYIISSINDLLGVFLYSISFIFISGIFYYNTLYQFIKNRSLL